MSRGGFYSVRSDFFVQRGKWYYEVLLRCPDIFQIGNTPPPPAKTQKLVAANPVYLL